MMAGYGIAGWREKVVEHGFRLRRPADALKISGVTALRQEMREHFLVLSVNHQFELLWVDVVSIGSLDANIVHPREVFRPAITHSAAGIMLVHNHPSGDPEPSKEDVRTTRRLAKAGELLGIAVLDHLIVARRGVVSLKARGLL